MSVPRLPASIKLEQFLKICADINDEIKDQFLDKDSCVASSVIWHRIFKEYGVKSRFVSVQATYANKAAYDFIKNGEIDRVANREGGSWMIGAGWKATVGQSADPGKWDGHLVLNVQGKYVFDGSFSQFSRPQHDMPAQTLVVPHQGLNKNGDILEVVNQDGCVVALEVTNNNRGWQKAPDYLERHERFHDFERVAHRKLGPILSALHSTEQRLATGTQND